MLLLGFLQHAGVADGHLTVDSVGRLQGLFCRCLFGDLGIAPLLLLHVLHPASISEACHIFVSYQMILTLIFSVENTHAGDLFTRRWVDSSLK